VKARWGEITDFGKSEHPADITESMAAHHGQRGGRSRRGGNEFIDVDLALGYQFPSHQPATTSATWPSTRWASGASRNPLDEGPPHTSTR
jgi:3-hydroxyacyl-CoA dehydrogenase/3a,7a,12a-trihydroxy-5b-cholest-24-enoyl-CoA hydratase